MNKGWLWELSGSDLVHLLIDAGLIGKARKPPATPQPMIVEVFRRDGRSFCGVCKRVEIYRGNKRCRPCYVEFVRWKERLRFVPKPTEMHQCECGAGIPIQAKRCRPCRDRVRRARNREYMANRLRERRLDDGAPRTTQQKAS